MAPTSPSGGGGGGSGAASRSAASRRSVAKSGSAGSAGGGAAPLDTDAMAADDPTASASAATQSPKTDWFATRAR